MDVNDNAPEFSSSKYTALVAEDNEVGSTVLVVDAIDRDGGHNGQVRVVVNVNDRDDGHNGQVRISVDTLVRDCGHNGYR